MCSQYGTSCVEHSACVRVAIVFVCCVYLHVREARPGREMLALFTCGNHANNLVEVSATSIVGSDVVSKLWAAPSVLRLGSYFLRLVAALRRWLSIDGNLQIRHGVPPSANIGVCASSVGILCSPGGPVL